MRTRLLLLPLIALAGCASLDAHDPPVCDGKHRRPANPYGSILQPTNGTAAPSEAAPLPAPEPDEQSALPAAIVGCGQ